MRYVRPQFYPKQFAAIFDSRRYSVIEASTKAGKTSGCVAWLAEEALRGKRGQHYWWVAPVSHQARIAFNRMRGAFPQHLRTARLSSPPTITLINGAIISFLSGDKPDSLYGEDVWAVVLDEASRMKEEAHIAVRSTLTKTRGKIRVIGNVKGRKNWAYQLARRAESGREPELGYHKITAMDAVEAGVLDAEEIEFAKGQMPEQIWRELYFAEPSDDGGNPFGEQHIRHCVNALSAGAPVVWGWDLAKRQDYTVGIALDQAGYVCRFERFQRIPWDEILKKIIRTTGSVRALVDSTGVGDPIVDQLQRAPNTRFEGYHFTQASKQKLMEGLAVAIQSHAVTYPDGPIVQELLQFEYEVTRTGVRYAAAEGHYDDCVCALALAVMCRSVMPAGVRVTDELLRRVMSQRRRV